MDFPTASVHKPGPRKLDAFERYETRPKRQPLGEIPVHQNKRLRALQAPMQAQSHPKQLQNHPKLLHPKQLQSSQQSQTLPKHGLRPKLPSRHCLAPISHAGKRETRQKLIDPFSLFASGQERARVSERRIPAARKLSHAFAEEALAQGLTQRQDLQKTFIDSQVLAEPTSEDSNMYDTSRSVLYGRSPHSSGSFQGSMPRMVLYNAVVARSNALIRKHCDGTKLVSRGAEFRGERAGHVAPVIVKVSSPSPLLSAVTTDLGLEFLLANTDKLVPSVGSRLVLGDCTATVPKLYTSWRIQ